MDWEPLLEDIVEVDAPPERVWEVVSDLSRMPEWSPQVTSVRLKDPDAPLAVGSRLTHRNRLGDLEWTTHAEVVRLEPGREIAFRVEENYAVWSFRLEPTDVGTRLTQRRETPDGLSDLSVELTDGFMGGQREFTETLRAGMRQTLERISAAC